MRALPAGLAMLLAACGQAPPRDTQPAPSAPAANTAAPAPTAPAANSAESPDPAALEGLSPFQRRAYRKGFEDCRAGRYEPDPWPEAYRIGCAAAQDEQAG
jgi:hypothetical protein